MDSQIITDPPKDINSYTPAVAYLQGCHDEAEKHGEVIAKVIEVLNHEGLFDHDRVSFLRKVIDSYAIPAEKHSESPLEKFLKEDSTWRLERNTSSNIMFFSGRMQRWAVYDQMRHTIYSGDSLSAALNALKGGN